MHIPRRITIHTEGFCLQAPYPLSCQTLYRLMAGKAVEISMLNNVRMS